MRTHQLFTRWGPAFVWMIGIFAASTDLMSAEHTSRFAGPFFHWLLPGIAPSTVAMMQLAIRKAAHLTEYAVLAILFSHAVQAQSSAIVRRRVLQILAVCACYASLDEFHQSFNASRTASAGDVLIDICGASAGLLIHHAWRRARKAVEQKRARLE